MGDLGFLRGGRTLAFPDHVVLSPDQSDRPMFLPALLFCGEKIVAALASEKEDQCKHQHDFAYVRPLTF